MPQTPAELQVQHHISVKPQLKPQVQQASIKQQIQENATMLQQFQAAMQLINQLSMADPMIGRMAAQAGLIDPTQMPMPAPTQPMGEAMPKGEGTAEERAAANVSRTDNSMAAKARLRAANMASPT